MGGFILVPSSTGQPCILSFELFQKLVRNGLLPVAITEVTEEEIQDRSKGDGLTKSIAICQALWFIVQCIARHVQNLAVSEFELVTLALSGVSGIMFLFWWNKPKEVRVPMRVDLIDKLPETDVSRRIASGRLRLTSLFQETDITPPVDATNEDSGNDDHPSNSEITEWPRVPVREILLFILSV